MGLLRAFDHLYDEERESRYDSYRYDDRFGGARTPYNSGVYGGNSMINRQYGGTGYSYDGNALFDDLNADYVDPRVATLTIPLHYNVRLSQDEFEFIVASGLDFGIYYWVTHCQPLEDLDCPLFKQLTLGGSILIIDCNHDEHHLSQEDLIRGILSFLSCSAGFRFLTPVRRELRINVSQMRADDFDVIFQLALYGRVLFQKTRRTL